MKIKLFVQANDYQVWKIIMSNHPNKGLQVPKKESEYDERNTKIAQLNAKAMHTLFCALRPNAYNWVSLCDNAKEI